MTEPDSQCGSLRVAVRLGDDVFFVDAEADCSFGSFRDEAVRQLAPDEPEEARLRAVLHDSDGCSWPLTELVADWVPQLPDGFVYLRLHGSDPAAPEAGPSPNSDGGSSADDLSELEVENARAPRRRESLRQSRPASGAARVPVTPAVVVQDELWRIFTYYSCHGAHSASVESLAPGHFFAMLEDCGLAPSPVTRTESDLAVRAHASSRLSFRDFLGALLTLSSRLRPDLAPAPGQALYWLLYDHILPRAGRWDRDGVSDLLRDHEVEDVFERFRDFLVPLFRLYSSSRLHLTYSDFARLVVDTSLTRLNLSVRETRLAFLASIAYPFESPHPSAASATATATAPPSTPSTSSSPSAAALQRWPASSRGGPAIQVTLPEFVEALGRCALMAFSKTSDASVANMIKALFAHFCRVPAFSPTQAVVVARECRSDIARSLHQVFQSMWFGDGRPDYLRDHAGDRAAGRLLREARSAAAAGTRSGSGGGERAAADAELAAATVRQQAERLVGALLQRGGTGQPDSAGCGSTRELLGTELAFFGGDASAAGGDGDWGTVASQQDRSSFNPRPRGAVSAVPLPVTSGAWGGAPVPVRELHDAGASAPSASRTAPSARSTSPRSSLPSSPRERGGLVVPGATEASELYSYDRTAPSRVLSKRSTAPLASSSSSSTTPRGRDRSYRLSLPPPSGTSPRAPPADVYRGLGLARLSSWRPPESDGAPPSGFPPVGRVSSYASCGGESSSASDVLSCPDLGRAGEGRSEGGGGGGVVHAAAPLSVRSGPSAFNFASSSAAGPPAGLTRPLSLSEAAELRMRVAAERAEEAARLRQLEREEAAQAREQVHGLQEELAEERVRRDRELRDRLEDLQRQATAREAEWRTRAEEHERERERQLLLERVSSGEHFVKYSRKGKPQSRFVVISPDLHTVLWGETPAAVQRPGASSLPLSSVREVLAGLKTDTFRRFASGQAAALEGRALSLVAADRTLDLVAPTGPTRDAWVKFFRAVCGGGGGTVRQPATVAASASATSSELAEGRGSHPHMSLGHSPNSGRPKGPPVGDLPRSASSVSGHGDDSSVRG